MGPTKYGIIASILLIILWIFLPMDSFYSGDSGVKIIQVENLIKNKYSDVSLDYNGKDIDKNSEISPFQLKPNCYIQDGKNYSVFPILFSFLSSFLFLIIGYPGLYVLPLISAFGVLFIVYKISNRYLSPNESIASMCLTLIATPLLFYSFTFSEHVPTTFLVLLSILIFLEGKDSRWWGGIALGMSVWFRSEIIILIPILLISGLYIYKHKREIVLYSLTSLIPVIALLSVNKMIYGEWFGHVVRNLKISSDIDIIDIIIGKSTNLWRSLVGMNTPQLLPPNEVGWSNSLAIIKSNSFLEVICFAFVLSLLLYGVFLRVRERNHQNKIMNLLNDYSAVPIVIASSGLLFTVSYYLITCVPDKSPLITVLRSGGVFSYSPYISIALLLPIIKHKCRNKWMEIQWILLSTMMFLVIAAVAAPNDGGIRYGARYLLPIMPFLSIVSFIVYYSLQNQPYKKVIRVVFIALIISSILVQVRGYQILYYKKKINKEITQTLLNSSSERIAMQAWWMIFNAAPVTVLKKTHILKDTRYLAKMIEDSRRVEDKYLTIVLTKTVINKNHVLYKFFKSQNVEIYNQKHVVNSFDTFFNYTVITLKL